ncbi:hypothetical protein MUG94_16890 [Arthrobacter gengyunqii]|uniref:Uncharacterized protein n=1 Tax=Arthrobacter gengyunqii TaxID=2886940 RepID=A0A9X1M156_9MICC|nr:hypothetical protein [Arthrobacter gengyunqii]MCC3268792.1 hypothetical protein [Arthrobacter gengyunqii]UOY96176.1 hypothetical protein MUG94_16890 [Arthrobacter gengyunqii]
MSIPKNTSNLAKAPVAVFAAAALLFLSGCGQDAQSPQPRPSASSTSPDTEPSANPHVSGAPAAQDSTTAGTTGAVPATPSDPDTATDENMTQLLQLHTQLKTDLGSAYSDAWIENNQLHVAVTTPEAEAAVAEAGAVPYRAEFTDAQLQDATAAFKAWLGTDSAPQVQLHWLSTSGRTGSITVRVPAEQVQPLTDAVTEQQPTGAVQVIVEESSGPATPLGTNGP